MSHTLPALAYGYDALGNRTSAVDAEGRREEWLYAGKRLQNHSVYRSNESNPDVTRYAYDSEGHLRFEVSAEGRVTEHRYHAVGTRAHTITYNAAFYPTGFMGEQWSILDEGQMSSWASAQDKTKTSRTDYLYDARDQLAEHRVFSAVRSDGGAYLSDAQVTRYVYNQYGQLLQQIVVKGASNHLTSFAYDGEGRQLSSTGPTGAAVTTQYLGNTIRTTSAEGKITTTTYDASGVVTSVVIGDGSTSRTTRLPSAGMASSAGCAAAVCRLAKMAGTRYRAAGRSRTSRSTRCDWKRSGSATKN